MQTYSCLKISAFSPAYEPVSRHLFNVEPHLI